MTQIEPTEIETHSKRVTRRKRSYEETLDDFPTPPWATRALLTYVLPRHLLAAPQAWSVLEPAAGRGHMVRALREKFPNVFGYDVADYGGGLGDAVVSDYLDPKETYDPYHLMITNPPFRYASEFVERGLREASMGVAVLMRTIALEGADRWRRLYERRPPSVVAVFSGRIHTVRGRVVRRSGAMMSHSWFLWGVRETTMNQTRLIWIPPTAQAILERDEDYEE